MPVQQEATIVVPSEDPKKKKTEEQLPDSAPEKPKGKEDDEFEELVRIYEASELSCSLTVSKTVR